MMTKILFKGLFLSLLVGSSAMASDDKNLEAEFFSNEALRSSWFLLISEDREQRPVRVSSKLEKTTAENGVTKWVARATIPGDALDTSEGQLVSAASFADTSKGEILPGPILSLVGENLVEDPPLVCRNTDYEKKFQAYLKMDKAKLESILTSKTKELKILKSRIKEGVDSSVINWIQVTERKLDIPNRSKLTTRSTPEEIATRYFHARLIEQLDRAVNQ